MPSASCLAASCLAASLATAAALPHATGPDRWSAPPTDDDAAWEGFVFLDGNHSLGPPRKLMALAVSTYGYNCLTNNCCRTRAPARRGGDTSGACLTSCLMRP